MKSRFDKKVLILCHDTLGKKMAGPGIRYQNLAEQISKIADVTLGLFYNSKETPNLDGIQPVKTVGDSYRAIFDKHDTIFAQWMSNEMLEYAHATGKTIIFDLYAPVPIEYLASLEFSAQKVMPEKDIIFSSILDNYKRYLTLGDFFVYSNDRQRDFWMGFITASDIVKPTNFRAYSEKPRFGLCPMGISSKPAVSKNLALRKRAGLKKDDFVMLWTGGIWDWFDAQVVIKAVKKLDNSKIKLVFLGTQHPNTKVYKNEMDESYAARKLAKQLKLIDNQVFFLDGWVDYDERVDYLLDADVAIYADKLSLETRFSHRTRVLDHIWTGLPTICSEGDYLSEELKQKGMAITVAKRSAEDFAKAIKQAFDEPALLSEIRDNIAKHRPEFTWDHLSADLLKFIKEAAPKTPAKPGEPVSDFAPKPANYRAVMTRRVKNSIKVLIGRVDV
jgi:glycosyltransferase involved in cell wall biosynthesis